MEMELVLGTLYEDDENEYVDLEVEAGRGLNLSNRSRSASFARSQGE